MQINSEIRLNQEKVVSPLQPSLARNHKSLTMSLTDGNFPKHNDISKKPGKQKRIVIWQ